MVERSGLCEGVEVNVIFFFFQGVLVTSGEEGFPLSVECFVMVGGDRCETFVEDDVKLW